MKNAVLTRTAIQITVEIVGPVALALLAYIGQVKGNIALSWFPVDLTTVVSAIVILCGVTSQVAYGRPRGTILFPILLAAFFLLGLLQARFSGYGLNKIETLYTVTFICMLAPFFILRRHAQRKRFLLTLAVIGVSISVVTLIIPDHPASYSSELMFPGTGTIGTARMAATAFIVILLFAVSGESNRFVRWGALLLACVPLVTLIATESRGALIGVILGLVIALIMTAAFRRIRIGAVLGVSVSIIAFAIYLSLSGTNRILPLFAGKFDGSTTTRLYFWSEAVANVQPTPWGIGWGNFIQIPNLTDKGNTYPHNLLLESTLEGGWLVGLALVVFIVWSIVLARRSSTDLIGATTLALLLFTLVNSMISGDINSNRLMWMLASCAFVTTEFTNVQLSTRFRHAQRGAVTVQKTR